MNAVKSPFLRLADLPLWRLIVALDDAERTDGPDSSTVHVLARAIRKKLGEDLPEPFDRPEVRGG